MPNDFNIIKVECASRNFYEKLNAKRFEIIIHIPKVLFSGFFSLLEENENENDFIAERLMHWK